MISFRYHIFTIVAIFLAIGIGLLVGNTVVQPGLVNDLRNRTDKLSVTAEELRGQVGILENQMSNFQRASDILPLVDRGGLIGVRVAIVTYDGVDSTLLSEVQNALATARADLVAVLSVTDRMAAADDATRKQLASLLGMPPDADPTELQAQAASSMAQRLADGLPRLSGSSTDVLDELLRGEFLRFPPGSPKVSEGALAQFGGKGLVILVVAGGLGEPIVPTDAFMVPLVDALVQRGATVAAAESASTEYPFIATLRSNPPADGAPMVTVDDADFSIGGAALVLGLERLLLLGQGGDYGIKGDVRPIPPLP